MAMQSESTEGIDDLRAERDELEAALTQARGSVAWVISDILRLQAHDSTLPEGVTRWLDSSILPRLRRAAGWGSGGEEEAGQLARREPDSFDVKKIETGPGSTRIARPADSKTLTELLAEEDNRGETV